MTLHLLILEDNPDDAELAVKELEREGFDVEWIRVDTERGFREVLTKKPDLILVDYAVPSFGGLDALKIHRQLKLDVPLIVFSGTIGEEVAVECVKSGATDYVLKDNISRLSFVVKRALDEIKIYRKNKYIEEELRKRTVELQEILKGTISALITVVEYRDLYTSGHQQRVSELARTIAKEMGFSRDRMMGICMAGALHDIGKIAIPVEILSKPDLLSETEFDLIKNHSKVGYDILTSIKFPWPLARIILQHHERVDGSGYPNGLLGKEILIEAKILGVADVVEAMTFHRPYRPALGIDKALEEISNNKGKLYDTEVVKVCLNIFKETDLWSDI